MIRVANAPCSWGVLEFELEGEVAGFEPVLDEMEGSGYEGTELGDWGFMPTEPAELGAALRKRHLELVGAFVPVALSVETAHSAGVETAVKTAKLMADAGYKEAFLVLADNNGAVSARTRNAGRVTAEMGLGKAERRTFAKGANLVARTVREETGLRTAFHHHCAGYVETPQEVSILMDLTDPDLLGLVFDTGHYRLGGGDPVQGLEDHFERIWHVHFKDCSLEISSEARRENWDYFESVRAGVFCELGQGCVDFQTIVDQLRKRAYEGWAVVEQDVLPGMGTPEACARRNRDYLQSLSL
ncbi:MAG TPA: TIM barrel protein [Acidobacteriota bacterium]|nr:TIM barrel protein [Acidobacteriota bacterium]